MAENGKDYGNCKGCGSALDLAPGIDTFCPNTACDYDRQQMYQAMRRYREAEEREHYERLREKYEPRLAPHDGGN